MSMLPQTVIVAQGVSGFELWEFERPFLRVIVFACQSLFSGIIFSRGKTIIGFKCFVLTKIPQDKFKEDNKMQVDVLIVGGGVVGLWTLDQLRRSGVQAMLVENESLGAGQTINSQGIIHGGLKYSLRGILTASAHEIREMPGIWRDCLSGKREPNLSQTLVRSHCCYLWQTTALASQAGMLGAQLSLRVKPHSVPHSQRPEFLQQASGQVYRLNEQVLSPSSLLENLARRNSEFLFKIDAEQGLKFQTNTSGKVIAATLQCREERLEVEPQFVILTAGAGNEQLSSDAGKKQNMQRRPLQMVMLRGDLPAFQGHCIDGAKTRLTVTSAVISKSQTVWQLGGQIAEAGVQQNAEQLLQYAITELQATLPDLPLDDLEFATYRVDRAEKKCGLGLRPDTPQIIQHQNVLTCWPTKLAFAPRAAELLEAKLKGQLPLKEQAESAIELFRSQSNWPKPTIAKPAWETVQNWYRLDHQGKLISDESDQPLAA